MTVFIYNRKSDPKSEPVQVIANTPFIYDKDRKTIGFNINGSVVERPYEFFEFEGDCRLNVYKNYEVR